ncbi:MAG TPA: Lrp/AsnC family transcriptional regulator [Bacteroidetes bacterium]|nr:Lrp/AsnC family transcriptional regulator [Bacteroidota bacterium]
MQTKKPNSVDKNILAIADQEVESLLKAAQNGDAAAWDKLSHWVYLTGQEYYQSKIAAEQHLSKEDAEDLTTSLFLEFENNLPHLKSATRFTRYLLKQNLKRYLRRKRQKRLREVLVPLQKIIEKHKSPDDTSQQHAWQDWTDDEFLQYQSVLQTLQQSDDTTQQIIRARLEEPPIQFNEIAARLSMSETSVRMRAVRFYSQVRKQFKKLRYKN